MRGRGEEKRNLDLSTVSKVVRGQRVSSTLARAHLEACLSSSVSIILILILILILIAIPSPSHVLYTVNTIPYTSFTDTSYRESVLIPIFRATPWRTRPTPASTARPVPSANAGSKR